jgi:hypothetical protein
MKRAIILDGSQSVIFIMARPGENIHLGVLTEGRPPGTHVYVHPCEAKSLISALETALGEVSK